LEGEFKNQVIGINEFRLKLPENTPTQILFFSVSFGEKFYVSKRIMATGNP
jgi:hypothetical protein